MMQQTLLQISQEIDQQKQALTQQVEDAFAQYLQPSAPQPTVVQNALFHQSVISSVE